jgi:hypothetical protein
MTRQRKLVLGSVAALSWLGLLSYAIVSGAHRCRGLELIPEPADWRSWPKEPGNLVGDGMGSGKLFGFRFTYDQPMGAKYPGYGSTYLTDPALCERGGISLDSWFSGEAWWIRHPDELFLHREPKGDRLVISGLGMEANGRMRGEELVAAFHRVLPPNTAQQR